MAHVLIGAFDRYDDADRVKQALLAEGIDSGDIQLSASGNPDMVATDDVEPSVRDEPLGERISGFVKSLFGDDAHQAGRYSEAMRRGSTLVTVTLDDDDRLDDVEDLMSRHGAIDIDERSANWTQEKGAPATASTETLTTGYPDATSTSVGLKDADNLSTNSLREGERSIPGRFENARPRRDTRIARVHIASR